MRLEQVEGGSTRGGIVCAPPAGRPSNTNIERTGPENLTISAHRATRRGDALQAARHPGEKLEKVPRVCEGHDIVITNEVLTAREQPSVQCNKCGDVSPSLHARRSLAQLTSIRLGHTPTAGQREQSKKRHRTDHSPVGQPCQLQPTCKHRKLDALQRNAPNARSVRLGLQAEMQELLRCSSFAKTGPHSRTVVSP